jgi:hypothetical protein
VLCESGGVIQVLGYVASAVIVLSLTMTSLLRLRLIGVVGATLFAIYGVLVQAWPVVATNVVILGLHAYFLWRAWTDDEYFTLLEVRPESMYLHQFLAFYATDIRSFQPEFLYEPTEDHLTMFILRDMVPAGLFIARRQGGPVMDVDLDYVIARYRDLKPARFLFHANRTVFEQRGVELLRATAKTDAHRSYLEKVGFTPVEPHGYEMTLRP